jgi:RNA recognition motif-containing protein
MNIYVGNLPHATTDQELKDVFSEYGEVDSASIITDRDTGRSRGFGFVEMPDDGEANNALKNLNGSELGGRTLTVNEAKPRGERSERRW